MGENGVVTLMAPNPAFGQNVKTNLPMMPAEEIAGIFMACGNESECSADSGTTSNIIAPRLIQSETQFY